MEYTYYPKGVCSRKITLELKNGLVHNVHFTGGCSGNLQAVSRLVEGMKPEKLAEILKGISCGLKSTSCCDQLVYAVEEAVHKSVK